MSGWENKKERNEPEEKKKTFWAEDESRVCMRATLSLIQSRALGAFLLAGTSTGALEQRRET